MKQQSIFRKLNLKLFCKIPWGFTVITCIFSVIVMYMWPFHELGFSDDFAYNLTVKNFLHTGQMKILDWAAPSLITQTLWGALFSILFGFSYKTLHLATVTALYIGIVYFYLLLKKLSIGEKETVLLTLYFLGFPMVIRFTYSFMTTTYYVTLMIISLYYSIQFLRTQNFKLGLLVSVLGGLTFLERQLGILIPFSLITTLLFQSLRQKRLLLKPILYILIPTLMILLSYNFWLHLDGNMTIGQYQSEESLRKAVMLLKPLALHRLYPTNEVYDELVYRIGYFVQTFSTSITPILLLTFPILTTTKIVLKQKRILYLSVLLSLIFLYWTVFARQHTESINILETFIPPFTFWGNDPNLQKKIWNGLVLLSIPLCTTFYATIIQKFYNRFFEFTRNYTPFIILTIIIFLFVINNVLEGISTYGFTYFFNEVKNNHITFVVLSLFSLVAAAHMTLFSIKQPTSTSKKSYLFFFFTIFALSHLAMSSLGMYVWEEYSVPFIPLYLMGIGYVFFLKKFSTAPLLVLVIFMIIISTFQTKVNYDKEGIIWEQSVWYLNVTKLSPQDMPINNWAWIPYSYYEPTFKKRLNEVGGDKYKIRQAHTWWGENISPDATNSMVLLYSRCPTPIPTSWHYPKSIKGSIPFIPTYYCFALKKDNLYLPPN